MPLMQLMLILPLHIQGRAIQSTHGRMDVWGHAKQAQLLLDARCIYATL